MAEKTFGDCVKHFLSNSKWRVATSNKQSQHAFYVQTEAMHDLLFILVAKRILVLFNFLISENPVLNTVPGCRRWRLLQLTRGHVRLLFWHVTRPLVHVHWIHGSTVIRGTSTLSPSRASQRWYSPSKSKAMTSSTTHVEMTQKRLSIFIPTASTHNQSQSRVPGSVVS